MQYGKIIKDNNDGTYAVLFDDIGEEDDRVPEKMIKKLSNPAESLSVPSSASKNIRGDDFRKGDRVEARYNGLASWYAGTIVLTNRDGTYDIDYDNGRNERGVISRNVRMLATNTMSSTSHYSSGNDSGRPNNRESPRDEFKINDMVEARHKGGNKWYPGRVKLVDGRGTYSIRYADGDEEARVPAEFIRLVQARSESEDIRNDSSPRTRLRVGDRVEGNFRGRGKFFPGKIVQVSSNGRYDIRYDDGDEDRDVARDHIRQMESGQRLSSSSPRRDAAAATDLSSHALLLLSNAIGWFM